MYNEHDSLTSRHKINLEGLKSCENQSINYDLIMIIIKQVSIIFIRRFGGKLRCNS